MKTCKLCGETKPLDEFHRSNSAPDGRQYRCKTCATAAARQWALDHPDAKRAADRKYNASEKSKANRKARREGPMRERILEQKRESYYRNHDTNLARGFERSRDPEEQAKARARYAKWRQVNPRGAFRLTLKNVYGISLEEWDAMIIDQSGLCAICDSPLRDVATDHDHETGRVRAILCSGCNSGIGLLREDPEILRKAIAYLEHHRAT